MKLFLCILHFPLLLNLSCRTQGSSTTKDLIISGENDEQVYPATGDQQIEIFSGQTRSEDARIFFHSKINGIGKFYFKKSNGDFAPLQPKFLFGGKPLPDDITFSLQNATDSIDGSIVEGSYKIYAFAPMTVNGKLSKKLRGVNTIATNKAKAAFKLCDGDKTCHVKIKLKETPELTFDFQDSAYYVNNSYAEGGLFTRFHGSSPEDRPFIFITGVLLDSLAYKSGLKSPAILMSINGKNYSLKDYKNASGYFDEEAITRDLDEALGRATVKLGVKEFPTAEKYKENLENQAGKWDEQIYYQFNR